MNETAVQDILERIDRLTEEDRLLLEERLAARIEKEWRSEAVEARKRARARGINQAQIDEVVHKIRHGR